MAKKNYKKYFDNKMKQAGVSNPGQIPKDKRDDFFKDVDRGYKAKDEEVEFTPTSDTRAGQLLAFHYGIEEDFYKKNKGNTHRNRKANGMGNVSPRKSGGGGGGGKTTTSAVSGVNIAKPGI